MFKAVDTKYMQQNNIVSVNQNPLFQSAIQGDATRVASENNAQPPAQSNSLTLTVLDIGRSSLQLQVQGTKERLSIPIAALQIEGELNKGDVVVLTSVRNNVAKLVVVEASAQFTKVRDGAKGIPLSPLLLRQLANNWSQLTLSELNRIDLQPIVDTKISSANLQDKLINWLFQNGQDALKNKFVDVFVKYITKSADGVMLTLDSGRSKNPIEIKLPKEWFASVDQKSSLTIRLNADPGRTAQRVLVGGVFIDKKPLPFDVLRQVNQNLSNADRIAIEKTFKQSFLTTGVSKPERESLIVQPDDPLLDSLKISKPQKTKAANMDLQAVLVRPSKNINSMPQLLIYAKPTIIRTNAENLSSVKSITGTNGSALTANDAVPSLKQTSERLGSSYTNLVSDTRNDSFTKASFKLEQSSNSSVDLQSLIRQKSSLLNVSSNGDKSANSSAMELLSNVIGKTTPESQRAIQSVIGEKLSELIGSRIKSDNSLERLKSTFSEIKPGKNADAIVSSAESGTSNGRLAETTNSNYTSALIRQLIQDQLLSAPTQSQSNSATSAAQTLQNNTMVEGLINMLSLRLLSKFDGELKNALTAFPILRGLMQSPKGPLNNNQVKSAANELEKLDTNNELLKSLNKANIRHQSNLLRSLDAMLQQQDTLYFTLPNIAAPNQKDIELKIRAINDYEESKENTSYERNWLIDMRLDIGDEGDILAKIKLAGPNVELNLYASEQALMRRTNKLLPHLTTKLSGLGLNIVERRCYFSKNTEPQISGSGTNNKVTMKSPNYFGPNHLQQKSGYTADEHI